MTNFTIEQLEAMQEKITQGERYLHEDDWDGLMVVNDDGRDMTFGDKLRVKVEAGHPEHDGESIVAIPKLIAGLIAEKQARQKLRAGVEEMRDWYVDRSQYMRNLHTELFYKRLADDAELYGRTADQLTEILEENNG